MTTFITSDTHFRHANIIKYCNRPFKDIDHMTEELIARWNDVVTDRDTIYHLGDFAMGGNLDKTVPEILSRLKGIKVLIPGNHDHPKHTLKAKGWSNVLQPHEITIGDKRVWMQHYNSPDMNWPGSPETILLHGHSHGQMSHHNYREGDNYLDVGVDCWDYRPIQIEFAVAMAQMSPAKRAEVISKSGG